MAIIEVKNVYKSFDELQVLNGISLDINEGEVISIIGSSGSGKSTLLRCLNLLEEPTSGEILFKGIPLLNKDTDINEVRTHIGMVFQSFNLFNNKNVIDNCTLAQMKVLKRSKKEAEEIAHKYLKKVGMDDFSYAKSTSLSGGQKQRVAIARALCMNPEVLLFDEPTSALDPVSESEIYYHFKEVVGKKLTLYISHRLSSCIFSDRILVLDGANIVEEGTHKELMTNENGLYYKMFKSQAKYYES